MLILISSVNNLRRESSMSTSLLYHAFGVRGYGYRKTDFFEGAVIFTMSNHESRIAVRLAGRKT